MGTLKRTDIMILPTFGEVEASRVWFAMCYDVVSLSALLRELLSLCKPMEKRCYTCLHENCKLSAVSCELSVRTMQL